MLKRIKAEAAWAKSWFGYTHGTVIEEQHNKTWADLLAVADKPCRCDRASCTECKARRTGRGETR